MKKEGDHPLTTKYAPWLVIGLLLLLVLQTTLSMRQKSVTIDEITYIATGYYHLKTGDFQMNLTNPPLMKMVSAVPLLFINPELPPVQGNPLEWDAIEEWQYARVFMYDNTIDADRILFTARLSIVVVSVILGLYLFTWSRALYGPKAALLVLFWYSFSPNILAHSRLATQDLGLTAFMFICTYYFWRYMNQPTRKLLFLCGLLFGLTVITKSTAFFLLPIYGLYGLGRIVQNNYQVDEKLPFIGRISPNKRWLRPVASLTLTFAAIGLLSLVVINMGYGFQGTFQPITEAYHQAVLSRLPGSTAVQSIANLLLSLPLPLPSPYIQSLIFQFGLTSSAGGVYFAGTIYHEGLWYLMLASFLLKTPLPTLILLMGSLVYMLIQRRLSEAEQLILIFIAIVLFIFSYFGNVNVGVRYILPIYPFVFLLIGRLFSLTVPQIKVMRGGFAAFALWYVVGTILIYPHYLAYFNETIGGPKNGYKYLADSNVDWGQDLKGLKQYMADHQIDTIKLAYFGSADANYYDIDYEYLPSVGLAPQAPDQYWWYEIDADHPASATPQPGTLAVSAHILASPGWLYPKFYDAYAWLRSYEPIDQVGYSILIYQIDE